uniref:CHK kinase-like domain-containing protein n=1 Tax=Timema bartmani TaxID=61472 RepID=A0A7R9EZ91_9NEOP|nr:unnamed protein product [Timema bartmani]
MQPLKSQSMTSLEQSQQGEEDISSDRDFLQELLRVSEDDPTLILHHLEVSPACNSGDNYMSAVTRVRVRGSRKAGTLAMVEWSGRLTTCPEDPGSILSVTEWSGRLTTGPEDPGSILSLTEWSGRLTKDLEDSGSILSLTEWSGRLNTGLEDPGSILSLIEWSGRLTTGLEDLGSILSVAEWLGRLNIGLEDPEGIWSLVLKRQPPKVSTRELLRTDPVFKNETAAYSRVILSFERFSGDGEDAPRVPKCLHANLAFRNDVIVLEDLQPAGFRMCDRQEGLDLEHSKLALQELARYHALSLAMKCLEPEAFLRTRHQIREVIFVQEAAHLFSPSLETACKMAIGGLRISALQAGDDGGPLLLKAVKALESQRGTIFNKMVGLVKPSEPFSVITHGDFWINNILFRYKEEGGGRLAVEDVRLLDLQVARYCSPAIDILHFLYTSTFRDTRRRHYQELLRAYHQSLTAAFQRLVRGSPHEGEVPMTLRELRREVTRCEMYGLFAGMWIMTAVTADVDNLPDVGSYRLEDFYSDESLANWISTQTPSYRQRTKDLVLEYLDKGIL